MGHADTVAYDPSVAGYRATSPRKRREEIDLPISLHCSQAAKGLQSACRPIPA